MLTGNQSKNIIKVHPSPNKPRSSSKSNKGSLPTEDCLPYEIYGSTGF